MHACAWVWVWGAWARVALLNQHAILSAASLASPYFSTLSHKRQDVTGKKLLNVKCLF